MNDVGIDPGKQGGIVMVNWELKRTEIYPLPLAEDGSWDRDRMCQLADTFRFARARVGIEKVHAFPGMSAAATTQVLAGYYLWLGVLAGKGIGVMEVRAEDWRTEFGLKVAIRKAGRKATAAEKEAAYQERKRVSLAYARANLFHPFVTPRGRDLDGPAEAAIIAQYVQRKA